MTENKPERVLDAGALKALAHPLRVRIYDLLSERGPQTASTLAAMIGETSGATSYHLRALAAQDLIREVPGRGTARERWWERPKARVTLPSPDDSMSPAGRAAAQIVNAEYFRLRNQRLMEYLARPRSELPEEWREYGSVTDSILSLTAEQMGEVTRDLMAFIESINERYSGQDDMPGTRRVAFRTDLFDLPGPSAKENRP
jgi:DNA-binding transcriptional ArsR family regulator